LLVALAALYFPGVFFPELIFVLMPVLRKRFFALGSLLLKIFFLLLERDLDFDFDFYAELRGERPAFLLYRMPALMFSADFALFRLSSLRVVLRDLSSLRGTYCFSGVLELLSLVTLLRST
jgi:hypothetical protein